MAKTLRSRASALRDLPWSYLLLALLVRAWLVVHTAGVINGDEALIGIQATHILRGERPIYFYGQSYMGSLEAYLVALCFALFGPSVWAMRLETLLLSLAVVWLTWKLAAALAEHAHLPLRERRWFMHIATLFAAMAPLYDAVAELYLLGGYIETFLLMMLLLLTTLRLAERLQAEATPSTGELAGRWATLGSLCGLGLWINPLIIPALLTALLWLSWSLVTARRRRVVTRRTLTVLAAIPGGLIGLSPAIIWGAGHQWANVTYLFQLGSSTSTWVAQHYPTRLAVAYGIFSLYTTCVAPRVISGALPTESTNMLSVLHLPLLVIGVVCTLTTGALAVASLRWQRHWLVQTRRLATLPLLFAGLNAFVFCATTTATTGLFSCDYDVAGRYGTPLLLALPFFYATCGVLLLQWWGRLYEIPTHPGLSLDRPEREEHWPDTGGRPWFRFLHDRRQKMDRPPYRGKAVVLFSLFLILIGTQLGTYALTDGGLTFQSPYCPGAPADTRPLIAYLQHAHIRSIWANNWIAYPLLFHTGERIIAADPLPLLRHVPQLNRLPDDTEAVQRSDRPSMIVIVLSGNRDPLLLRLLASEDITYRAVRFPAEPGVDILVVTPLNHTVRPYASWDFYRAFLCTGE